MNSKETPKISLWDFLPAIIIPPAVSLLSIPGGMNVLTLFLSSLLLIVLFYVLYGRNEGRSFSRKSVVYFFSLIMYYLLSTYIVNLGAGSPSIHPDTGVFVILNIVVGIEWCKLYKIDFEKNYLEVHHA